MNTHMIIETIGYVGSAIVLVSFLMTSVFKLRVVNTAGSVTFMIYALIIQSYPTALMNLCLALINIHFLWKMRHTGRQYELVQVEPGDKYLGYLLSRQMDDIRACFPGIELPTGFGTKVTEAEASGAEVTEAQASGAEEPEARPQLQDLPDLCFLITCQGAPAGITIGRTKEKGTMELLLDYSLPEYRDFSIGKFLCARLKDQGVEKLLYRGPTANHMEYLKKMGFEEKDGAYEKRIVI